MTGSDDRRSGPTPPSRGGQLGDQAEVDRAVRAITEYCKQTGRPLRDVATDVLQGRLVIDDLSLHEPHPGEASSRSA